MNPKRFKSLNGFWTNISPVKEGKKNHNYAEAFIQTGTDKEDKILFFFEKPNTNSKAYEKALTAFRTKQSSIVSGLSEDSEGKNNIENNENKKETKDRTNNQRIHTVPFVRHLFFLLKNEDKNFEPIHSSFICSVSRNILKESLFIFFQSFKRKILDLSYE
jgi:hypothetical protein